MPVSSLLTEVLEHSVFLTAYDPSDLPGRSVDPMGFERGYVFLADKILPGLTNAGSRPRYFSMMCAGSYLAQTDATELPKSQYRKRLDHLLRLERFWALANVLASQSDDNEPRKLAGLRGVQDATNRAKWLIAKGQNETNGDFKMLARQVPYGAIGIYGSVADGMRLLDRKTLMLTPDLGERLAEAFIHETSLPTSLKKAVHAAQYGPSFQFGRLGRSGLRRSSATFREQGGVIPSGCPSSERHSQPNGGSAQDASL